MLLAAGSDGGISHSSVARLLALSVSSTQSSLNITLVIRALHDRLCHDQL